MAAVAAPILAGAATHGGAVPGGAVIHVTSLADSGPGSLRASFSAPGPKVIVFDVGGVIHLATDLKLATDNTTVAGQSAPAPGITLTGGSLRLRASNLVVQHIGVRPGPADTPQLNDNRDSLTIGGGTHAVHDIRVENVSLSWSVDENADIADQASRITVRDSIVAEALRNAGHPKGRHSMGMLINKDSQAVAVTGNLFASNMFRNPVIARGASVFVGYNLITDPGENAIHFYDVPGATPLRAAIEGNVVTAGSDSDRNITAVQIPDDMARTNSDAVIYVSGNQAAPGEVTNRGGFTLAGAPPVALAQGLPPPADVRASVLRYAGARPGQRDAVDARIVAGAQSGTGRIIDNPADAGGLKEAPPTQAVADVPADAFAPADNGMLKIEAWLCARSQALGAAATPDCPVGAQRTSQRR
jgi:pectate lyase